ncbi:MAG: Lpg1974 family pore-forming outer membrane protein [Rhabdochlamydiaceae bacterium]
MFKANHRFLTLLLSFGLLGSLRAHSVELGAQIFYWGAHEGALEYANLVDFYSGESQTCRPKLEWNSGFKLKAAYFFSTESLWDVKAEYLYYHSAPSGLKNGDTNKQVQDVYWGVHVPYGSALPRKSGSQIWRLKVETVDFNLGRTYHFYDKIVFRPFLGLKGARQKQSLDIDFLNTNYSSFRMLNHSNMMGLGPKMGFDFSYSINQFLAILHSLSATGLYSYVDLNRRDYRVGPPSKPSQELKFGYNHSKRYISPIIEFTLGPSLMYKPKNKSIEWQFKLLGELQWWMSQNNFIRMPLSALGRDIDLAMYGLNFEISCLF